MAGFLPFANLIPKLPDFFGKGVDYAIGSLGGMPDSKARKNQIHDIRTLRRREYQDMVHSLKEAGLNPVLAVGASPGHASAQMLPPNLGYSGGGGAGVGSAAAANRAAGVAEAKTPSEIGKNEAASNLMGFQGQATQLGIPNILQQWELNSSTIDKIKQDTKTGIALEALYGQDAINKGASAKKLEEETSQIHQFGLPGQTWEGLIRQGFTNGAPGNSGKTIEERMQERPTNAAESIWNWGKQYFGGK